MIRKAFKHFKPIALFLSIIGLYKTICEILIIFSFPESIINNATNQANFLYLCLAAGLISIIGNFVKQHFNKNIQYYVNDTDTKISIVVKSVFDIPNADVVIPSNIYFNVHGISSYSNQKSVQTSLISKYFDKKPANLQEKINLELGFLENKGILLPIDTRDNYSVYPYGSLLSIEIPTERTIINNLNKWYLRRFYFFALTDLNNAGRASISTQQFSESISRLWQNISLIGIKGHVVVPILASGQAKFKYNREIIIKEIIKSFLAANHESSICEELTIAIYPRDYKNSNINMDELDEYLRFNCQRFSVDDNLNPSGNSIK